MKIIKTAVAGTMESSDIMITLSPAEGGISIDLDSTVKEQFGGQICAVIRETLQKMGITAAEVSAVDKGALDCTVKARTEAAALRAGDTQADWEGLP